MIGALIVLCGLALGAIGAIVIACRRAPSSIDYPSENGDGE